MKNILVSIIALLTITTASGSATETATAKHKVKFSGGADLVSGYIWRGSFNAGASIQPTLEMNVAGFTIGAWGNVDFGGNGKKEVDLSARYSIKGFTVGVTDYWWAGEGALKYFEYQKGKTAHLFEANLSYVLPIEKFPLTISWNTVFAGADLNENGKNNYSTYIEISYPFTLFTVDLTAKVGAAPWYSPAFLPSENRGFSVCNVALSARKAIRCTKKFSIPLFSELIFNPATEDIHLVFGVSLRF